MKIYPGFLVLFVFFGITAEMFWIKMFLIILR